ncbi:hypothetical protein GCM10018787_05460 [Streptomyces thermodiastaticus]|nr:hypothetical protein GCM10018787_05460 [Streptomyces thermodiastaticus]
MPRPVLGGAGMVLFGSVAAGGIRTLAGAGLGHGENATIVAVSLAAGMIPVTAPEFARSCLSLRLPRTAHRSWHATSHTLTRAVGTPAHT